MIDKVNGNRIGADNNKYLIALWRGLQTDISLPTYNITKYLYNKVKIEWLNNTNIEFDDFEIGWVGFTSSYNGGFLNTSYSGIIITKIGTIRDYISESKRNIIKQIPLIKGVKFIHSSYDDLNIPDNSIIYCDPPYANTAKYSTGVFNHDKFWEWCRVKSREGHKVYISEYNAPDDFICIWNKKVSSSLSLKNKLSIEKLFVHQSQYVKPTHPIDDIFNF